MYTDTTPRHNKKETTRRESERERERERDRERERETERERERRERKRQEVRVLEKNRSVREIMYMQTCAITPGA